MERKELAQKTKEYRKLDDEQKKEEWKGLLKCRCRKGGVVWAGDTRLTTLHSLPDLHRPSDDVEESYRDLVPVAIFYPRGGPRSIPASGGYDRLTR